MSLTEYQKASLKQHLHHQSAVLDDDGNPISPGGGQAGVEGGYAPLDSGLLVPISYLPVGTGASQVAAGNHSHASSPAFPLDNITLHPTYGDHFEGPSLDAKWTRHGRVGTSGEGEFFFNSHMSPAPRNITEWGDTEPFTPTDEFEIRLAGNYYNGAADDGFGPVVLSSAGTGLWLTFRGSASHLGLHTMTTFSGALEPVQTYTTNGAAAIGQGRKTWWSIVKKKCAGVDIYWWRYSFNGSTWDTLPFVGYSPTAFTPALIGWWKGIQTNASPENGLPFPGIDWINVVNALSIGNNLLRTPTSGTVTASTGGGITGVGGTAAATIDGTIADSFFFSNSSPAGAYINYAFSVNQTLNRVRFYSRGDAFGGGYVETSDGTKTRFVQALAQQGWFFVDLPAAVSTSYLRIVWTKGGSYGQNPGFFEVEAYLAS